ncbi:tetratricopeptide repeat protein [Lentzea sp. NPDC005914]|uniref:tetratricopeptide repeat protein n=1 Tax=Lentzea sp. NPDC005914 TaxID=3154572 RepID=UPI0033F0A202
MDRTFGEILRRHRVGLDLTQQALAEKAQLSEQAIGALERGDRRFPQAVTMDLLVGALGLIGSEREEFVRAGSRKGKPRHRGTTPRQLPAGIEHFTGRSDQVRLIAGLVRDRATAGLVAITGMGGVGKTSLAVHVGHLLAEDFPDGQLYVDLQGHGAREPVAPLAALGLFLRALGVAGKDVPGSVTEAAARLRTELAGRRVLLLLDNAASSEQVTPLLPGTSGAAAIITSRRALLAVRHARQVHLDVLAEPDALTLLASSAPRVILEPDAAAEVVRRCGGLPLAVRLAGARLAARPAWPVSYLAERLADAERRLDELDQDECGVRACFALSIDVLAADDAAAYPLLAWPDVPDLSVTVAARVLDCGEEETERLLERLTVACLLEASAPGRYRLHDLLRVYGAELASAPTRSAALTRLLELYGTVAWSSYATVNPGSPMHALAPDPCPAPQFADDAAFTWLDGERHHLLAAVRQAVTDPGVDSAPIALLALGLFEFYRTQGLWWDWRDICETALRKPGDDLMRACLLLDLAVAKAGLAQRGDGDFPAALHHIEDSVALFEAHGDDALTGRALNNACYVYRLSGAYDEAIAYGERALTLANRDRARGLTLVNLAEIYALAGDRATQHRYLAEALAILEPMDDAHGIAYALVVLGLAHRADGHLEEAIASLRRSAEQWRRIADTPSEANTLIDLGETLLAAGQPESAREVLTSALALIPRYGDPVREKKARALLRRVTA